MKCPKCSSRHPNSILQYVCHFQPPLFLVSEIIKNNQYCVSSIDCENQLPLHIAVKNGCSSNIISYLVAQNVGATSSKDKYGRLPIHLTFETKSETTEKYKINEIDLARDLNRAIKCLCMISPETVITEDDDGVTALECALNKEVDIDIYYELMSFACKARKRNIISNVV